MTSISTNIRGERVVRYTCAETAQLVRKALHSAFPGVKFSVRSNSYSGGASIDVRWVDGPNGESVKAAVRPFEGATFDAMTDCKDIVRHIINGHEVQYGADFVHCQRDLSGAYLRAVAERVARYYRLPVPTIHDDGVHAWLDRNGERVSGLDTLGDVILQRAWETAAPVRK